MILFFWLFCGLHYDYFLKKIIIDMTSDAKKTLFCSVCGKKANKSYVERRSVIFCGQKCMTRADYKPYEPRGAIPPVVVTHKKYQIPDGFEKEDFEVFPLYDMSAPDASQKDFVDFMMHVQEMADLKKHPITTRVCDKIHGDRTIVVRPENDVGFNHHDFNYDFGI